MTSTMVAPRTTADDHSTRQPFPEVTCTPSGFGGVHPATTNVGGCATGQTPVLSNSTAGTGATASLSADGCYRWSLTRRWAPGPTAAWIMLNPSRADAATDDPTLRRVIGFARAAGFGQITVTNVYGWRSPSPSVLRRVADPVGVGNDQAILAAAAGADLIVAAWGTHADPDRAAAVLRAAQPPHRVVPGPDPLRAAAPPPLRPRPDPAAGLPAPAS